MLTIYFDGLCAPFNPGGIGAYGYVIQKDGKAIKKGCRVIGEGPWVTDNVAEFTALLRALQWISGQNIQADMTIKGDSLLVINQLKGIWEIKSYTSRKYVPQIQELLNGRKVTYQWISREENKEADMLSNVAYKKYVTARNCKLPENSL